MALKPGLYCVATPIGNLKDITLRALEVLQNCDIIACEDTRESSKLLGHYGISKPKWSYHDHNADQVRPKIVEAIQNGQSVALISDAGTPLISDPGTKLVQACRQEDIYVTTLPGPSAVTSALVLSGLMSHAFTFLGFFDKKKVSTWQNQDSTLVFFESAKRLLKTLTIMEEIFHGRKVAVVREISKMFEETTLGAFAEVIQYYTHNPARGEIVIVLGQPEFNMDINDDVLMSAMIDALSHYTFKEAVDILCHQFKEHKIGKKKIYSIGLLAQKKLLK